MCELFSFRIKGEVPENDVFGKKTAEKGRSWRRGIVRENSREKQQFFERKNEKGFEKRQFFVKNKWGERLEKKKQRFFERKNDGKCREKKDNFLWKKIRQKAAKNDDVFEDKIFF